jgi:hypothetical protein
MVVTVYRYQISILFLLQLFRIRLPGLSRFITDLKLLIFQTYGRTPWMWRGSLKRLSLYRERRTPPPLKEKYGLAIAALERNGVRPKRSLEPSYCFITSWDNVYSLDYKNALTIWSRSTSKCYLRIRSVPQREHQTSPLQRSTG